MDLFQDVPLDQTGIWLFLYSMLEGDILELFRVCRQHWLRISSNQRAESVNCCIGEDSIIDSSQWTKAFKNIFISMDESDTGKKNNYVFFLLEDPRDGGLYESRL